jgi:hypothetical protein
VTKVYEAIAKVQGELAKTGISKNRRNKQGEGYMFRGIDDVYAALSPLLAANGLCIIPRVISRDIAERQSSRGNPLFYVTVHAEFDFVSAEDGSKHTAATFGEAMDSGDKATNKAMSAAYKYAAFMTFAIPTEGDNDADATTHDVAPRGGEGQSKEGAVSPHPDRKAKLDGPIDTLPKLEVAIKGFVRNMGTIAAADEWWLFKNANADLLAQAERDHPEWWGGWPEQPDGFTPLKRKIELFEATICGEETESEQA